MKEALLNRGVPGDNCTCLYCLCKSVEVPFLFLVEDDELEVIIRRYLEYDKSEQGKDGITLENILAMPEFADVPMIPFIYKVFQDRSSKNLHPMQFVDMMSMLSSKTPDDLKYDCKLNRNDS